MKPRIVTLLTDFGTQDHYVASMKGVILGINPRCTLIDISHEVIPHDVREGALILANGCSYFPRGTIHLAVVDPGVGSPRKPILLVTKNYFFLGPDNGLLSLAAKKDGVKKTIVLSNRSFFRLPVSTTFHGRDIFASVAGHLSADIPPELLGRRVRSWVKLDLGEPKIVRADLVGEISHMDAFGNIVTNISRQDLNRFAKKRSMVISLGNRVIRGLKKGYWEARKGELLALIGSGGYLEISVREGDAQKALKSRQGDKVRIRLQT
jgi:S-adenosyl-L-methionine hydrolase (adenosine-forming)